MEKTLPILLGLQANVTLSKGFNNIRVTRDTKEIFCEIGGVVYRLTAAHLDFGDTTERDSGRRDATDNNKIIWHRYWYWGAMPNAISQDKAHGIANIKTMLAPSGTAIPTAGQTTLSLPFAAATAANNISISADATKITMAPGSDRRTWNAWVYLQYTRLDK